MKDNNKNNVQILRLRRTLEHSKLVRWTCIVFPFVVILSLFWTESQHYISYDITTEQQRCDLQTAFINGDFRIGSHRSLGDSQFPKQPNCLEGLMQLSVHGITYLDLDLIWDQPRNELVVAHPMEFQGTTNAYSPCAKTSLTELIRLLRIAMPKWYVSLEPKADWDRTREFPLLKEPAVLLQQTLNILQATNLQPQQCCVYVDSTKLQRPDEVNLLEEITHYCNLCYAMRRYEGYDAQVAVGHDNQNFQYEYVMSTIEFHPNHPNYNNTVGGIEALSVVQQSVPKTVYWLVDTPADLERVASIATTTTSKKVKISPPAGIVSNRPLHIQQIFKDPLYGWCPQEQEDEEEQQQQRRQQKRLGSSSQQQQQRRLGRRKVST